MDYCEIIVYCKIEKTIIALQIISNKINPKTLGPDGRTCTAWDYASLLCNLYSLALKTDDPGCQPKRYHYYQTSCTQSPIH